MAHKLTLIAARGLDRMDHPIAVDECVTTPSDAAKTILETPPEFLCHAAVVTLRKRAGYLPARDPRPMKQAMLADAAQSPSAFSREVVRLLGLIYYGQYHNAYAEWIHWVAVDDRAFPPEALPLMLSLATRYPHTRALTKRVIGSRGRWLIDYSGHRGWHWAKHIKPGRRPRLTKYKKLENRVIDMLSHYRFNRLPLETNFELQRMTFPWSYSFSDTLAMTIENILERNKPLSVDHLERMMDSIQWQIHTRQRTRLVQAFRANNAWEEAQQLATHLEQVLAFRAELAAAFGQDSI